MVSRQPIQNQTRVIPDPCYPSCLCSSHLQCVSVSLTTFTPFCANGSANQKMTVKLDNTTVTAISDGGLSLYPRPSESKSKPFLCIEVLFPLPLCISPRVPLRIQSLYRLRDCLTGIGQTPEIRAIEKRVHRLRPRCPNLRPNARHGVSARSIHPTRKPPRRLPRG